MSGIRDAIVHGGFLNDPIGLLEAIGQTVRPTCRASSCPTWPSWPARSAASRRIGPWSTTRSWRRASTSAARSRSRMWTAIRALAAELFPVDGSLPSADYAAVRTEAEPGASPGPTAASTEAPTSGSGVSGCAAAPRPKPTPTPKPTATAAPSKSPEASPQRTGRIQPARAERERPCRVVGSRSADSQPAAAVTRFTLLQAPRGGAR